MSDCRTPRAVNALRYPIVGWRAGERSKEGPVPVAVAVLVADAHRRRQLERACFDAGMEVEWPDDLVSWCRLPTSRAVVVDLSYPDALQLVRQLERTDVTVIAMVPSPSMRDYREALELDVAVILEEPTSGEAMAAAVELAEDGLISLPLGVAHRALTGVAPRLPEVTPEDILLLETLASGGGVRQSSRTLNYSERHVRRLIRDLCRRLGAPNREELVVRAAQWGLLAERPLPGNE